MKGSFPDRSIEWLAACRVQQALLHGGSFSGTEKASRMLLRNIHKLEKISSTDCEALVEAFHEFNSVVMDTIL